MPAAPVIAKKLKAGDDPVAIGEELDRRAHVYKNNVDGDLSPTNLYLVNKTWERAGEGSAPVPLDQAIERRMGELKTKRKIRKDAVRAVGFVVSSNAQLSEAEAIDFLKESVAWFAERYGEENILAAAIHLDEDVPHAQLWLSPVIHDTKTGYDRLSAKDLFTPNKVDRKTKTVLAEGTMTKLQREFYQQVSAKWGYTEPWTVEQRWANGVEYKSQAQFKADNATRAARAAQTRAEGAARAAEGRVAALKAEEEARKAAVEADERAARERVARAQAQADAEVDRIMGELRDQVAEARRQADTVKAEIAGEVSAEQARLESVRQGADEAERHLERTKATVARTGRAVEVSAGVVRGVLESAVDIEPDGTTELLESWRGTQKEGLLARVVGGLEKVWERLRAVLAPKPQPIQAANPFDLARAARASAASTAGGAGMRSHFLHN